MVVDTSALIAIIFGEPDADSYLDALTRSEEPILLSAVTAVEAAIVVLARQGPEAASDLDLLRARVTAQIVPCDAGQVSAAIAGWRRFGKGRHSAALNLGDCFSYALARTSGDALLFKGRDFAQTDIRSGCRDRRSLVVSRPRRLARPLRLSGLVCHSYSSRSSAGKRSSG